MKSLNRPLLSILASALLALSSITPAQAAIVPIGVQNDIALGTVTGAWGWQLSSRTDTLSAVTIANLFSGIAAGDRVMIGTLSTATGIIDTLAAATLAEITAQTALNQTHVANGVAWYSNGYSMGFAGVGDIICQNSADVCGMNERDRMSWHTSTAANTWTQSPALPAMSVQSGWRSGTHNIYGGWERVIFTAPAATAVPEPGSLALAGLALAGLALVRKRSSAV